MLAEALRAPGYAAYRLRLKALLAIPEDADDNEIHARILAGFSAARLMALCEQGEVSPLERDQIIPLRTLKTRLSHEQPLTVDESDKLFRAAHIIAMAETVFGNRDKAKRWLNKPKERFSGETPMAKLLTVQGIRQTEEMLLQVAEGYAF